MSGRKRMVPQARSSVIGQAHRGRQIRAYLAFLVALVIALATISVNGMQYGYAAPTPTNRAEVSSNPLIVATLENGTSTTGAKTPIAFKLTINCPNGCADSFTMRLDRPVNVDPDAPLAVTSGVAYKIVNPRSPNPTLTFTGLTGVSSHTLSWLVGDNPAYPGVDTLDWTASYGDMSAAGRTTSTITGAPVTQLTKSANTTTASVGQYVQFETQYLRTGTTGLVGTLVDQLPQGYELVSINNGDLPEAVVDSFSGDVTNPEDVIFRKPGHELNKKYISYDPASRQIRVTVDKNVDNVLARAAWGRFRIRYTVKVVSIPAAGAKTYDNTWGWQPGTLQDLRGNKLTKGSPGTGTDAVAKVTYVAPKPGSVVKSGTNGVTDPLTGVTGYPNSFPRAFWVVSFLNEVAGPVTLVDDLRPQSCIGYLGKSTYKGTTCATGMSNNTDAKGVYAIPKSLLMNPYVYIGADGNPVSGSAPMRITMTDAAGATQVQDVPAMQFSANTPIDLVYPEGFQPVSLKMEWAQLPAQTTVRYNFYAQVQVPEKLFENGDNAQGKFDRVELYNDLKVTMNSTTGQPVERTAWGFVPVRQSFPTPFHNIGLYDSTFGGPIPAPTPSDPNRKKPDASNLGIQVRNLSPTVSDTYRPYGYVALPNGFQLTPFAPSEYTDRLRERCVNSNAHLTVPEGKRIFDPREVTWRKSKDTSPSGGELWFWTVPEDMVVPGTFADTSGNDCNINAKIVANGAAEGNYSGPLDSQFPQIGTGITAYDPEQKINGNADRAAEYGKIAGDFECDENEHPEYCTTGKRWNQKTASLTVTSYSLATVYKYAWGDKDGVEAPNDGKITTFLPADETRPDLSYATEEGSFTLRVGSEGSQPVSNYVVYDALPAAGWVKMNEAEGDQAASAGTHDVYDPQTGAVTGTADNGGTLVPVLTGPIQLPSVKRWDATALNGTGAWLVGPYPATIYYSTETDPCRPEMSLNGSEFPKDSGCTTFNAKNQWWTSLPAGKSWSDVRYFRIEFHSKINGMFDIPVPVKMPKNTVGGNGISDADIAVNRVAVRASDGTSGKDIGTIAPAVARIGYVPQLKVKKSVIIPADGKTFDQAKAAMDGQDNFNDYLLGDGDFVYFQIKVTTKNEAVLASPVIRDFIPAGLEYVETVSEHTVGNVYTDWTDAGASGISLGDQDTTPHKLIVWKPGKLTKDGVIEGKGSEQAPKEAVVTLKMRVTGDPIGTITNHAVGGTDRLANSGSCEMEADSSIDEDTETSENVSDSLGCDAQQITVAPSIKGSLFNLGASGTEITAQTPKVDDLEGKILVSLLDGEGNPVYVDAGGNPVAAGTEGAKALQVPLAADGTYTFGKVAPGEYQVKFEVAADASAEFKKKYRFRRSLGDAPTGETITNGTTNQIDGSNLAADGLSVRTAKFTVPGLVDGQRDPKSYRSVPTVDFAVGEVKPAITLTKTADTEAVAVGGTATFTISGRNDGNVDLTGVKLTDEWAQLKNATVTCTITNANGQEVTGEGAKLTATDGASLAVGDTYSCTVAYTVTQADVDGQSPLRNEASISGSFEGSVVTASGTAEKPVTNAQPQLAIVKTVNGDSEGSDEDAQLNLGDKATFKIVVTNTGNVTMKNVQISDRFDQAALNSTTAVNLVCGPNAEALDVTQATAGPVEIASIAPGAKIYCLTQYTAEQAFIDAGVKATNTASATGKYTKLGEDGIPTLVSLAEPVSNTAAIHPVAANSSIKLEKSAWIGQSQYDGTTPLNIGTEVTYKFTVTNTGNVSLTGVAVTDSFPEARNVQVTCPNEPATLAPQGSVECSATYTLAEGDLAIANANGGLTNTAQASATPPTVGDQAPSPVKSNEASATVKVADPRLTLAKVANGADQDGAPALKAGQDAVYTISGANTGNVALAGVVLTDKWAADHGVTPVCEIKNAQDAVVNDRGNLTGGDGATLQVGDKYTCTVTYRVTQADVDNQISLDNSATISGNYQGREAQATASAQFQIDPLAPAFTVAKTVNGQAGAILALAEQGKFVITVTNTGNVTLREIAVADSFAGGDPLNIACAASVAEAEGKQAASPNATIETLAPSEVNYCVGTFSADQKFIDGQVERVNTVTVTPKYNQPAADGGQPTATELTPQTATAKVSATAETTGLSIDKAITGEAKAYYQVGETITYKFTVTNTGNTTVRDLQVADPRLGDGIAIACEATELAPGAQTTCTAGEYTVTDSDSTARKVTNKASVSGLSPRQGDDTGAADRLSAESNEVTVVIAKPSITLTKVATSETAKNVGEIAAFAISGSNDGNVDLTGVKLTDEWATNNNATVVCTITSADGADVTATRGDLLSEVGARLAAGDQYRCDVTYTVTQGDLDNQDALRNTASITGNFGETAVSDEGNAEHAVAAAAPAFTVAKTVNGGEEATLNLGETARFVIDVHNTGNITLRDVDVTDSWPEGATGVSLVCGENAANLDPATATDASPTILAIAPGAHHYCVGQYTADQAFMDAQAEAGRTNTATVAATYNKRVDGVLTLTDVSEQPVSDTAVVKAAAAAPAITLTKSVSPDGKAELGPLVPGDEVTYTFGVRNTGNVTVTELVFSDQMLAARGIQDGDIDCPKRELAGGEEMTCTAKYTLQRSDVTQGEVANHEVKAANTVADPLTNTASVTGTSPQGVATASAVASATVIVGQPQINLEKTGAGAQGVNTAAVRAGDVITYTITATNTGNADLVDAVISDQMLRDRGVETLPCQIGEGENARSVEDGFTALGTLKPGERAVCTAPITITQGDVDKGVRIENTARIKGHDRGNLGAEADWFLADALFYLDPDQTTSLALVKTIDQPRESYTQGEGITYLFAVTNTGALTVHDLRISDPLLGEIAIECPVTELAPGAAVDCRATQPYLVTAADVAAGAVTNTATASAQPPTRADGSAAPAPSASASVTVVAKPQPVDPGTPPTASPSASSTPSADPSPSLPVESSGPGSESPTPGLTPSAGISGSPGTPAPPSAAPTSPVTATGSNRVLARTGANSTTAALIAGVSALLGSLLIVVARRRREQESR